MKRSKRFQKFSVKTLTRIVCPNLKTTQKTGLSTLGVKVIPNLAMGYKDLRQILQSRTKRRQCIQSVYVGSNDVGGGGCTLARDGMHEIFVNFLHFLSKF